MPFDKRIKNPKKDILCYLDVVSTTDAYKESLIGKRGFFANTLQEFVYLRGCHFKRLAHIYLEAGNSECTEKYINEDCFTCNNGKYWKFFLPEECVEPYRLDEKEIIQTCYLSLYELNKVLNRQNSLLQDVCNQSPVDGGHKAMTWHMRDTVKEAVDGFKHLLNEFEKGNY